MAATVVVVCQESHVIAKGHSAAMRKTRSMTIANAETEPLTVKAEKHCKSKPVSNSTPMPSGTGLEEEKDPSKGIIRRQLCLSCNEELPSEQQMQQDSEGWCFAVPILKKICKNEKVTTNDCSPGIE